MGGQTEEETCVLTFLNWYNKQHNSSYVYERAEARFTELNGELRWDFTIYEHGKPREWIGVEVKELEFLREGKLRSAFWKHLCSDLTSHLQRRGIQGGFEISLPPIFELGQKERQRFLEMFSKALIDKQSDWEVAATKDIGPDIASRFPNWPTRKSEPFQEYDEFGSNRPSKLEITKVSDSGCEVSVVCMLADGDVAEEEKKAFNEVDIEHANKQLELAKRRGARETILLLANLGADEGLTNGFVQNLDCHLISDVGCIYLVNMADRERVVRIYSD